MNTSSRQLTVDDLKVVVFQTEHMTDRLQHWKLRNRIPHAEACARQVWYGSQSSFDNFPENAQSGPYAWYSGADAYAYLLRLSLGLESKRTGVTNIKGEFFIRWSEVNRDNPDAAKKYGKLIQNITADARAVEKKFLSGFKIKRSELVARDLSGQKKEDVIAIIGHASKNGDVSIMTDGVARVSGNRQVGEIIATHPDAEVLDKMNSHFQSLRDKEIISSKISVVTFSYVSDLMALCDKVYVTLPMGMTPHADERIIEAWKNHGNGPRVLAHMKGDPQSMGLSTEMWQEARLVNYISPEDIYAEMERRGALNDALLQHARASCEFYGHMRCERGVLEGCRSVAGYTEYANTKKDEFSRDHRFAPYVG